MKSIDDLIAASSLGSPEVVAVMKMKPGTPPEAAERLIKASAPEFYRPKKRRRRR